MIDCQYKDVCSSYPFRCDTCRHNKSKKKDYYEPDDYYPWVPYIPWRQWPYDIIWCDSGKTLHITSGKKNKKRDYYQK